MKSVNDTKYTKPSDVINSPRWNDIFSLYAFSDRRLPQATLMLPMEQANANIQPRVLEFCFSISCFFLFLFYFWSKYQNSKLLFVIINTEALVTFKQKRGKKIFFFVKSKKHFSRKGLGNQKRKPLNFTPPKKIY